jgi:hypothetical protein
MSLRNQSDPDIDSYRESIREHIEEIHRLRDEVNVWKALAAAREEFLVCYRLGRHPSEAAHKRMDRAKAKFARFQKKGAK